jgi:uncharacterized protein YqgV (UPF0045/DUF77 family)
LKAIEKLETSKNNINKAITNFFESKVDIFTDKKTQEKLYRDSRVIIKKIAQEHGEVKVPQFIRVSRTIDEVVAFLSNEMERDDNQFTLKGIVTASFNEFIDYLEDERIDIQVVHVACEVPDELTFEHILESIQKCENRIKDEDYSGAVTSAKTLVEGTCKEILQKFNETVDSKTDLPALFTKVRQKLNLNPSDPNLDKSLKEVLTGLIKIVNGISEVRNSHGDSHIPKYKIDRHHALIVVNSAKTVVTFLFNTYEYQLEKGTLVKS